MRFIMKIIIMRKHMISNHTLMRNGIKLAFMSF